MNQKCYKVLPNLSFGTLFVPFYGAGYAPPREESRQVEDLLQDVKRIEYHKGYLAALARAIR